MKTYMKTCRQAQFAEMRKVFNSALVGCNCIYFCIVLSVNT